MQIADLQAKPKIVLGDASFAVAAVGFHKFSVARRNGRVVIADSKAHKLPSNLWQSSKRTGSVVKVTGGDTLLDVVDVTWLSDAASGYNISSDPRDYVAWWVPIVHANVPNRWYDCFSLHECLAFSPVYKMRAYETFNRAPSHIEHKHDDPKKAKGVIFGSVMREMDDGIHIAILQGFDRTKDPDLVRDMIKARQNAFSMAAFVPHAVCSVEDRLLTGNDPCPDHKKGIIYDGRLAYEECRYPNFFESSRVSSPANARACALSETKLFLS